MRPYGRRVTIDPIVAHLSLLAGFLTTLIEITAGCMDRPNRSKPRAGVG